ncbi:Uncharacterised protein [uncultured archaeon]|nr:Uncharacterised protein [uncultured archaeon]
MKCALARAVPVVEHHLGLGVIYGYYGIEKGVVRSHGPQADDSGRRLLAAAEHLRSKLRLLLVDDGDGVCSVVQGDVGLDFQGLFDAVVVLLLVLSPKGVDIQPTSCQGSSHLILRAQGIRAGDGDLRSACH